MRSSYYKIQLKATCQNFRHLRVMSMEGEFRSHHESTWHSSMSTIYLMCALFSLKFGYVIAETMGYKNGVLCFLIRCWDHVGIFNRKLKLQILKKLLGDTYEVYVSTIDFVKIVIIHKKLLLFFLDFVRKKSQERMNPLS